MKTNRIYYGEFREEQEKEWGKLFNDLAEKAKQKWYLNTLKDIQKHVNKEIKIIKKCIGE